MSQVAICVRADGKTKKQAQKICDELGLSLSAAINVFLHRMVAVRGLPFPVVAEDVPNAQTRAAIEEGLRLAKDSDAKTYTLAEALQEMGI